MRDEIRKIQALMESAEYVTDAPVATSVHLAMRLRKPLLIEGPAGVGKTEVAKVMARMLETNLIRLQCYEGLDASTALYEWNYQKQLLHIRLAEAAHAERPMAEQEHEIFSEPFLLRRPLLQAITQETQAPVLLVDEIDRSDEELEAFMLEVFSESKVIAITLNHESLTTDDVKRIEGEYEARYGVPTCDPLLDGCDKLVNAVRAML